MNKNVFMTDMPVQTDLHQIEGARTAISQFDIPYTTFSWVTDRQLWRPLVEQLEGEIEKAKARGAHTIVWRMKPLLDYAPEDNATAPEASRYRLIARLHFLPEVREGMDTKAEGDEIRVI